MPRTKEAPRWGEPKTRQRQRLRHRFHVGMSCTKGLTWLAARSDAAANRLRPPALAGVDIAART